MNNFIDSISKSKAKNDAVSFYANKARHCNQMAIWRSGLTKEAFIKGRDEYIAAARKAKN